MSRSPLLERIVTVGLLIAAGGVAVWALRPAPAPTKPRLEQPEIVIAIAGEVARPGVYRLPFGARVYAAIEAAGGFSSRADADLVNPARRLEDGDQVRVPARPVEAVVVTVAANPTPGSSQTVASSPSNTQRTNTEPAESTGKPGAKPKPGANASSKTTSDKTTSGKTASDKTNTGKTASSANKPKTANNRLLFALPKPPPPAPRVIVSNPPTSPTSPTPSNAVSSVPSSRVGSNATKPASSSPSSSGLSASNPSPSGSSDTGWGFNMQQPQQPSQPAAPDPAEILARGVNVNTASQAELEALPGVGPTLAARIIEARPYASTADLDRVKGIGPKMLEKIGPYLRF